MAHNTIKTGYSHLTDRLNRHPQGAPSADMLFNILKMLFSEKEAELVSLLPIRPFTAEKASRNWKMNLTETALSNENALHVLDYERASEVINTASHIGVGTCYCRHKMQHLGKACDAPFEICMTLNNTAASLIRHGFARSIDKKEGIDLLQEAYDNNLVQFGAHKVVVMAIERGKLQNLRFDNHVLWNHRALARGTGGDP